MFTVAFGRFVRILPDTNVGKSLLFNFAKIGFLSIKNISSLFVLAISIGGANVGKCWGLIFAFLKSSESNFFASFSFMNRRFILCIIATKELRVIIVEDIRLIVSFF